MIGIVPAAGSATRMQPLGGSKELLPLGRSPESEGGAGRLRAISEYLLERMLVAGADRIVLVVSSEKADLLRFYAQSEFASKLFFVVQPRPAGLCDAVFRAAPFVSADEGVLIGLPDTIWYPREAFVGAVRECVHLITFPVPNPEEFDAVQPVPGSDEWVARVEVKMPGSQLRRVWGAITAPGGEFLDLAQWWREHGRRETYLGDLLNLWMADGRAVSFDCQGTEYWDIGTPEGYERALRERVWENRPRRGPRPQPPFPESPLDGAIRIPA